MTIEDVKRIYNSPIKRELKREAKESKRNNQYNKSKKNDNR